MSEIGIGSQRPSRVYRLPFAAIVVPLLVIEFALVWSVKAKLEWLQWVDGNAMHRANNFALAHPFIQTILTKSESRLVVVTLPFTMLVVWCWFSSRGMLTKWRERQTILCGLVGTSLAVCSVMGIQKLIGSRPRPMYEPGYQFLDFFGGEQPSHDISSFPSDTSSLVFGLSTIVFLISKRAGTFAYIWATFVVAFLRVAVGLHYPSDVITSACNGTAMVLLLSRGYALWTDVQFSQFVVRYKASLYALAFGVLFEMTRLGGDLRPFLDSILRGTIAFLR